MALDCRQLEAVPGCRGFPDGSTQPVVIHYEYGKAVGGGVILVATRYTDAAGVPIVLGPGESVTPGECAPASAFPVGDGVQIAGPGRAALPPFNGASDTFNTSVVPGRLQSVTVTAFATVPGLPGQTASQVIVALPGGAKIALAPGETRTWSVERDQDQELKREFDIAATGNAYATISWTAV